MDLSLARALDQCRQAAHEVDPLTPVGIEGTQMPHAFGGYDLWRLSQVLDWVEPYDIGNAREIFGSFMPGKPLMTTVFEKDTNHARRRLWHLLLEGDRGCIIWWSEDCIDWKSPDYQLTAKARALAPVLKEMTSPLARLFLRARRAPDPVFIHYSQPSIQVDWLLESTADGSTWLRRFSSYEADHNRMGQSRNGWLKAFQDLGFSPRFISSEEIIAGKLPASGNAILVMSQSWALAEKEAAEIKRFLDGPGRRVVFCESLPGLFDEHGKLRASSPFEAVAPGAFSSSFSLAKGPRASAAPSNGASFAQARLKPNAGRDMSEWIEAQLGPMSPDVSVSASTCTRIHRFRSGAHQFLAFERNINYQMSENLKQACGNESLEKPVPIEATLREAAHIYDLRTGKYLGHTNRIQFTLDPWEPSLFALTAEKLAGTDPVSELGKASR